MIVHLKNNYSKEDSVKDLIRISVLGSTGSIGLSTLEIVRNTPDKFIVDSLVAHKNWDTLLEQCFEFKPRIAAITDEEAFKALTSKKYDLPTEFISGKKAPEMIAADPGSELVVVGIVGIAALPSVIAAIKTDKKIALANKETLVCAGMLINKLLHNSTATIIPVDSEHSAIFQLLQGERRNDISKLVITGSGGPFLNTPANKLSSVTPEEAVRHPRWKMGSKISVDSATLFNKGLELIEAHVLFNLSEEYIDIIIHPQSIVHSLVTFKDGVSLAHLSVPDMKGAISYALNYPYGRLSGAMKPLDLITLGSLEFLPVDNGKFPSVNLARECLKTGGAAPCIYSIANEEAVSAFLKGQISFTSITPIVIKVLEQLHDAQVESLDDLYVLEGLIRQHSLQLVKGS